MEFKKTKSEYDAKTRGMKILQKDKCRFEVSKTKSLLGDKAGAIKIMIFDEEKPAGNILIEEVSNKELADKYVQLRFVGVPEEYQGGNAATLLYEKAIEYAEEQGKNLLFDSALTIGAYKSFMKLKDLGYKIIQNPEAEFNGTQYLAPKSWVLRVER